MALVYAKPGEERGEQVNEREYERPERSDENGACANVLNIPRRWVNIGADVIDNPLDSRVDGLNDENDRAYDDNRPDGNAGNHSEPNRKKAEYEFSTKIRFVSRGNLESAPSVAKGAPKLPHRASRRVGGAAFRRKPRKL